MQHNSIRQELARVLVAAVAIVVVVGITSLLTLDSRLRLAESSLDRANTLTEQATQLRDALLQQETGFRGYELTGDASFLAPYGAGRAAQTTAEVAFRDASQDPVLTGLLDNVAAEAEAWQQNWVEPIMQQVRAGQLEQVREQVATGRGEQLFAAVQGHLDTLVAATRQSLEAARRERRSADEMVQLAGVGAIVGMTVLVLAIAAYVLFAFARPLGRLVAASERLDQGRPAAFGRHRNDEVGVLSTSLERLYTELQGRSETAALEAARASALSELSEMLSLAGDERGVLEACATALRRVLAVDAGDLLLLTTGNDRLLRRVSWGDASPKEGDAFDSKACPAIRTARVLTTDNGRPATGLGCVTRDPGNASHVCVPVHAAGRKIGVVHLRRDDTTAGFTRADIQLATQIGTETALVLANRRLVAELETMAMTDPLTGVKNARFFDAYLERELRSAERDRRPLGVIMFDVDHFKDFNDAYGHPAGDEALRTLTRTAESTIRISDTLARYGGEEFIVAVRNADLDETIRVAEKIRKAIETTAVRLADGRKVPMSASFGVANTTMHGPDRRSLVLRADQALYRAKQMGRNRVELPFVTAPAAGMAGGAGAGTGSGSVGGDQPR